MIRIGWPEIMAAAEAALASDGAPPSEADRRILRALARGVATVLGSTLHAPGDAPEAAFEEVALVNADGASFTLEPSEAMTADYALTLPVDAGVAGQALVTDGDGVLSWSTGAGAVTSVGDGDGIDCTPNPIVGAGTVAVDATVARRNAANTFTGALTAPTIDAAPTGLALAHDFIFSSGW